MGLLDFLSSIKIKSVYATLLSGTTVCGLTAVYGTKIYENSTCLASTYLGINACASDSAKLNNKSASYYINTGSTALCATCAGNATTVAGCTPSCFLGVTACACDSKCLGGHLPAYYMSATGGLTGATNGIGTTGQKVCLGGVLTSCVKLNGACFDIADVAGFNVRTSGNTDINIDAQQCGGFILKSQCGSVNTFPDFTNAIGFYGNIDQPLFVQSQQEMHCV